MAKINKLLVIELICSIKYYAVAGTNMHISYISNWFITNLCRLKDFFLIVIAHALIPKTRFLCPI